MSLVNSPKVTGHFQITCPLGIGYIPTSALREILAALDDQLTNDQLNGKNVFKFL